MLLSTYYAMSKNLTKSLTARLVKGTMHDVHHEWDISDPSAIFQIQMHFQLHTQSYTTIENIYWCLYDPSPLFLRTTTPKVYTHTV